MVETYNGSSETIKSPLEKTSTPLLEKELVINKYTPDSGYNSNEKATTTEEKISVTSVDVNTRTQVLASNKYNSEKPYGSQEKANLTNSQIAVSPSDVNTRIQEIAINHYSSNKTYPDFPTA